MTDQKETRPSSPSSREAEMAVDAFDVLSFDQLVRIFVDTDVDTHFIVSISRTSSVAELRELLKVTHRHCYPGIGEVDIGPLSVPGKDFGYHLADFLRIGQVFDKNEGKLFAEVKNCDPASSNRDGLFQIPAFSFRNSLTPKKVPLLAPQPFAGEPGALLAVEFRKELKEPKLLKEEDEFDADCLLGSQEPLDQGPRKVSDLADSLEATKDEKLVETLGSALCDEGPEISAATLVTRVSGLNPDKCLAGPDRISEGATAAPDVKKVSRKKDSSVSRKRDSSVSNGRPSKSRRLAEAPSSSTSYLPEADGGLEVRIAAAEKADGERLNVDAMGEDVNGPTRGSLSHVNRSGDFDSNLLSPSRSKRKKKKRVFNLDLTGSKNKNEAVMGGFATVEDDEGIDDAKFGNIEDTSLGRGVQASGINGLEVGREEKLELMPEGSDVSPVLLPKKKTKKKREQMPELKPEKKPTKRKKKKVENTPVASASLNHVSNEPDRENEQVNGQCTYVSSALVDLEHQLVATFTSPSHSQHVKNDEIDNGVVEDVEKKKSGNKVKEGSTALSIEEYVDNCAVEVVEKKKSGNKIKKKGSIALSTEEEVDNCALEVIEKKKSGNNVKKGSTALSIEEDVDNCAVEVVKKKKSGIKVKKKGSTALSIEEDVENCAVEVVKKKKSGIKVKKKGSTAVSIDEGVGHCAVEVVEKKNGNRVEKKGSTALSIEEEVDDCVVEVVEKKKSGNRVKKGSAALCIEAEVDNGAVEIEKKRGRKLMKKVNAALLVDEAADNDAVQVVEKKKSGKLLKKKDSIALSVDTSNKKGFQNSGRPSVVKLLKSESPENDLPPREAQVRDGVSGELNGGFDDKVPLPSLNLLSAFDGVETSTSYKDGAEASAPKQAAIVGSVEGQESPNSSKKAGRGAPSETRHSKSSEDVSEGAGRGAKASECQSFQKTQQRPEDIYKDSELSAAQMQRDRTSPSYSEAHSGHVIGSRAKVAHVSIDRLESESGHIDQFKVDKPHNVAHSRTCTGEISAKSDTRSASQAEVENQQNVGRKEDMLQNVLLTSPTPSIVRGPEEHASTSPKRAEGRGTNLKSDSLQFFSQDQSFQVAPTQVAKELSGCTTEDSSDESDSNPDDDIEMKKHKADNLGTSDKDVGESDYSSDGSRRSDNPPLTTPTPVPLVTGMTCSGGIKSSQFFKRRVSGVPADIEAKFAHFIGSQDGLDELMGITLGQRKRSMPIEPLTQAKSVATAGDSPLDLASNTQESVKNSPISLAGDTVGLERYQAIDLAPASQNSTGKLLTPQFKVPRPVVIEKISGAGLGSASALQLSLKGSPTTVGKALRLKRKDPIKQADEQNEIKGSLEQGIDTSVVSVRESSKQTFMDDRDAAGGKQTPAGVYNLLYTPESLKETVRDDANAATERKLSVEKTREERKRLEEQRQDSQFMIVNNTDHITEHPREEEKLESNDAKKRPCVIEDVPNTTGKQRKERKRRESVETGLIGSQETSGFDNSGKKKKRKTAEIGESKRKKKKLGDEAATILRETSTDRSARETEELYLKLERSNRELWLQNSVLSVKKDAEKAKNHKSPAVKSDAVEAVNGDDVAQSKLDGGVAQIDDAVNDNAKVMSDTPVPEGIAADIHLSPGLCWGTSAASDREDGVFLSQDEKAGAAHQEKLQKDVFDFVSEDERPANPISKSANKSGMKESKAKRMEDVASRAVQRVLDDEMLHVMDSADAAGKKPRKDAKPVKWTVRMRGTSRALASSLHGGTVPSHAIIPTQSFSTATTILKSTDDTADEAQEKLGLEVTTKALKVLKDTSATKARTPRPKSSGPEICPVGCGRVYASRTSAFYAHRKKCTGVPTD